MAPRFPCGDVALLKNRDELLFDVGVQAFAIDRAIEDARGRELVAAQGAEEGKRAPVAIRYEAPQAGALRSPSAHRSHADFDPGFIDEDQAARIEARPAMIASAAVGGRRRSGLAQGRTAFLNRSPSRRRNSQTVLYEPQTPRTASSSFRAWRVKCGAWLSRFTINA